MEHPCQTADFSGVSHRETLSNPSFAHRCAFAQQDGDQNLLGSTLAQSGQRIRPAPRACSGLIMARSLSANVGSPRYQPRLSFLIAALTGTDL